MIHFEIDGEEYSASITIDSENDMQAIQFEAPDGQTLWLHRPQRIEG
jgi:hypothetical protein